MRRLVSATLLVVAGVLFPLFVVATWAGTTIFDSATFSERAVEPLGSSAVRRELSSRLTEQLVRAGNQQAISFRPAFELAIEGAIDTDTFQSIFRTAVRRTHESLLEGQGASGLNLSDSFAIIASSLQLPGGAEPTEDGANGLDNSLSDVTQRLDDLGVWDLEETVDTIAVVCLLGSIAAAAGSILLAVDRRRAARRLGWTVMLSGAGIVVVLFALRWFVGRQIDDSELAAAIDGALSRVTDDLRLTALWIAAYGVVIAAAATDSARRYTPAEIWRRTRGWIERRRRTTWGTIALTALALLVSVLLIQQPSGNVDLIAQIVGLYIGYLAVTEILRLVRAATAERAARRSRWPRIAAVAGTLVVLVGVVSFVFLRSTGSAAQEAESRGEQRCNGDESLCDLTIDQVSFPGTHNSMSSSLYPGFLFGEQIGTISSQLDAGVRALLVDTYYGVPSTARLPGADTPIILTDRVAEVDQSNEQDRAAAERAAQLASRARRAADARRGIYLCHNHCELGAVELATPLEDIRSFLDNHPDDVVIVIIQDATTPADTAAAIEAAGLADRVATLRKGVPLPTLGELIDSGRRLLVFAENDAAGAPPWYHAAYEWFQETPYDFESVDEFNCRPNRGPDDAPLFLLNHWVSASPPDPAKASGANAQDVLEGRIQQCIADRGVVPNVVAVDFGERGSLVDTVAGINDARLEEERALRQAAKRPGTTAPRPRATVTMPPPGTGQQLPEPAGATVVTTLTGGDPARFCPTLPGALRSIVAWAEAILGEPPSAAGIADLVYAPLLVRDVGPYVDAAPVELAERAEPILARARAAADVLRALGSTDDQLEELARDAATALDAPASPDGVTVELALQQSLEQRVPADRLRSAALVFAAGQPDPASLLDLGFVPAGVGDAAGFDCAPALATI